MAGLNFMAKMGIPTLDGLLLKQECVLTALRRARGFVPHDSLKLNIVSATATECRTFRGCLRKPQG